MAALTARISDGIYKPAELRPADLLTAQEVRGKHEALRLDLADAIGVVLADRYRTSSIFTLDQHDFRAIAPLTAGINAFRILPTDTLQPPDHYRGRHSRPLYLRQRLET